MEILMYTVLFMTGVYYKGDKLTNPAWMEILWGAFSQMLLKQISQICMM